MVASEVRSKSRLEAIIALDVSGILWVTRLDFLSVERFWFEGYTTHEGRKSIWLQSLNPRSRSNFLENLKMNLIAWAVLGIVAGAIAKLLYPGDQGGSILSTMALGIVGAFLGGSVVTLVTTGTISLATLPGIPGLVVAILGSMIAIFLWGLIDRNAA